MKFEVNKHYDLFGYDVVFIEDPKLGGPYFKVSKGTWRFGIDMTINQNFLDNMSSREMKRLERLFRALECYAKFGKIESQEDNEERHD